MVSIYIRQLLLSLLLLAGTWVHATDKRIVYTGETLSNPAYHDGQLSPVVGVHNIQILRANREYPDASNCFGWTYNHQPMMAYHYGKFYVQYLSDSISEHIPPSQTFYQTSEDGYSWSNPQVLFPIYQVPDGYTKPGRADQAKDMTAIMHQRVGFYVASSGRLIAMANYGVALDPKDDPNDGNGIGRVVREIYENGGLGPIYFIYYNHAFSAKNTDYPYFGKSKDKGFRMACQEILDNPLYRMQWVEEADRDDPIIPLKNPYKAFSYYRIPGDTIVGLWKHALTSVSTDGGNSWEEPAERARGFVNSNAKIWGQQLTDGSYATVYNPSEFRWPLAISTSADGWNYTTLNLIHGEITRMRYGGNYKSNGPQYTRGILEGNGIPPDSNLWVSYSVNKEDMWVSRVPVPIQLKATTHINENFEAVNHLSDLDDWNIYSPLWASVSLEKQNGQSRLKLEDQDLFDYARVEKLIPASNELEVSFTLQALQNDHGYLRIEFLDKQGIACSRLELNAEGLLRLKGGARYATLMRYEPQQAYEIKAQLSVPNRLIRIWINGKEAGQRIFYAPVSSIERIAFTTGEIRSYPSIDTPADQDYDVAQAGEKDAKAVFYIDNIHSRSLSQISDLSILNYDKLRAYVDYFNRMEDENIIQAIPNKEAAAWMEENIPLFECPQHNFEEMYYFRWWSLRKHIKETPVGYGMTEFLVNRSYADQYNLISCALGHHIYESRWMRDRSYLAQIIHTWYRGNDGQPMKKMMNFSSWNIDAILQQFYVNGDKDFLLDMLSDLEDEYLRWETTHRLPNQLYWQGDVQDGMEESISGGRRKKYARPTINSYMYGNAKALARIFKIAGNKDRAVVYAAKADSIKQLVQGRLWNADHQFFETLRADTLAQAREAIGFIPWYFNLPDAGKFDTAWLQLGDERGFLAPYGQTTAERRHPEFRSHGVGNCEWDGAVWPFATSQTLTGLANYLHHYPNPVVDRNLYFNHLEKYVESQYHRGRPYIGEYLDEVTGYWLKGDQERSRYYNHSTFIDLIITGLIGLQPSSDNKLVIEPLIPTDQWDWFCLDQLSYRDNILTIVWDKNGDKYHLGKGFRIFVDGKEAAFSHSLSKLTLYLE